MRQNSMPRPQIGAGRQMPAWLNESRGTPPPFPVEPPPTTDESEYEEIDQLPRLNGSRRNGRRRLCSLCGNSSAVVSCEMCESQMFCGSCNDMYHRHPKRLHHQRKLIDPGDSRPPLPPKTFLPPIQQYPQEMPIVSYLPPVPPPRRNKRFPVFGMGMRSATSSPTLVKKTFDPMGTLKRFVGGMGQRPLPATPKPGPPLPPKPPSLSRPTTPVMGGHMNTQAFDRRHSSPAPQPQANFMQPFNRRNLPVHDVQRARQQSNSVVNLSMQRSSPTRFNGYPEWEEEDYFARPRAQSISTTAHRYPSSSQDASHFATLQRPRRGPSEVPDRPPPPLPRRTFPSQSQLGFQSSQSACNIHQMGMPPQFGGVPWNYTGQGYPMDFQQSGGMGYPGAMQRTPSNQSMGGHPQQQFFGWGGPTGFGPPMSQQEMEMEILARRQSEQQAWAAAANQPPPRPFSVSQSQPVTPQGSFRRKERPSQYREEQGRNEIHMNERFIQNQQMTQRSSTPRSLSRMNSSPLHFQEAVLAEEQSAELTEGPEGPWTCEHCTFINPKSSTICTVCCKTPSEGYKSMRKPNNRKGSTSSTNDNEDIPVIQSKLSISRGEKQLTTINLTESVERMRSGNKSSKPFPQKPLPPKPSSENEIEEGDEIVRQAQHHQIKINTKKPKIPTAKAKINDSNEDVYGSVPIQALTISPKIEIRRHSKTMTTGVGSSPPKPSAESISIQKKKKIRSDTPERVAIRSNKNSIQTNNKAGKNNNGSRNNSTSSTSSSSSKADSIKKSNLTKQSTNNSSSSIVKQTLAKRQQDKNGKSGSESNPSGSTSGSGSQNSGIASSSLASSSNNGKKQQMLERKTSKGTSPPPQSISTQTYEELPTSKQPATNKTSMTSIQTSSHDFAPPKHIEMSEKALRYARKAQHNNHSKMKRSRSTHLTSASEQWADNIDGQGRPLYRSSSRHSLYDDTRSLPLSGMSSRDTSPPRGGRYHDDFKQFPLSSWDRLPTPEDYFASLEDLVTRRRRDSVRTQEFELSRLLKEAEEHHYSPEDIQVALRMNGLGEKNPIKWLQENWSGMIETVQTLATKYGREKGENNQIGTISLAEGKEALRANRGNVWAAVTECIEHRRKKFMELQSRGSFSREDILTTLTANHGNLDAAYVELSKAQLKPFLMRIWGSPTGLDNDSVPPTPLLAAKNVDSQMPSSTSPNNSRESTESVKMPPKAEISAPKIEPQETLSLQSLEPEPRLELLVSSATKVSQEIEKAIQELKQTKSVKDGSNESSNDSMSSVVEAPQVKSDEEENFLDAVSASCSEKNLVSLLTQDSENLKDENILEIEIDDKEANEISDFIQNYEIVSFQSVDKPTVDDLSNELKTEGPKVTPIQEPQNLEMKKVIQNEVKAKELPEEKVSPQKEESTTTSSSDPSSSVTSDNVTNLESNRRISSVEIEQLLSTLTTTFTEMGQFATDMKAQIATEIQHQIAAAVTGFSQNDQSSKQQERGEQPYETVVLPESVSESVNQKIAKYKRLAAKKEQKSSRHKSPDARLFRMKEKSQSPSPASPFSETPGPTLAESVWHYPEDNSSFPTNTQIEIVGLPTEESKDLPVEDMPRDEAEYDSGPDDDSDVEEEVEESDENSAGSDVSIEEEEEEEEGQSRGSEQEEMESSVGSESEGERLIEGHYEEVDINRISDPEIYNNKDTEKLLDLMSKPSFVPSPTHNSSEKDQTAEQEEQVKEIQPQLTVEAPKIKSDKEIKIEKLMTEGKVETEEKAKLVLQLQDMNFGEEDSVFAANECSSMYTALSYLQQECHLCAGKFNARQMVSMLRCTHVCCHTCAKEYFTVQIRDKSIVDATCPFCSEPTNLTENADIATDYFNNLDILLKSILELKYHEMFQRKLRDWALARLSNFKWCSKCSSGFITEPLQTRLICPDCHSVTCAICLEQWDKFNHDHKQTKVIVCDSKSIVDYLNENSIECPRCHFRFALARGGCMHLTCTQCRHEFCSGCSSSFRLGAKCEIKLPICEKLGLHAHHPRNCLFYLRDKEPEILGKLLEDNAIPYLKENSGSTSGEKENGNKKRTCEVPIQKDTSEGLKDDVCGRDAPEGYATVCKAHYVEYLGLLIWQNHLDPISILSSDDLEVIVRRANRKHPGRPQPCSDAEFRNRLLKVIKEEIPL